MPQPQPPKPQPPQPPLEPCAGTFHCTVHDSAWDLNRKRCQRALGLPEPRRG